MKKIAELKKLLDSYGFYPKHRFGQNFLIDSIRVKELVEASDVKKNDLVLEVGPGTGILTEELISRGCEVVAVEIDRDLCQILKEKFKENIYLIEGDCLEGKHTISKEITEVINGRSFYLVSNLPYGCASPLIMLIVTELQNCLGIYVTIQKEVADRILAKPSTSEYGSMTVIINSHGTAKRICNLSPNSFWPIPKVQSSMIEIKPLEKLDLKFDSKGFSKWVRSIFGYRRKQLGRILGKESNWHQYFDKTRRPESLTYQEFKDLWNYFN